MTPVQGSDHREHRLRRDVEVLCSSPRHREVSGSLDEARRYCLSQLRAAGWDCSKQTFQVPAGVRMSDRGRPGSPLAVRPMRSSEGTNLVASRPGGPRAGDTLVLAHLDTVRCSPGADDNASGVAVVLEMARTLDREQPVTLALVDLEELGMIGARALAARMPRPGLVVCLESVGYFDSTPGSQRLPPGFGLLFPELSELVRRRERRADFLIAAHRRDSAEFVTLLAEHASTEGLPVLPLLDRRWAGRGQRVTRWVNPLLMDLDRSDHSPFWRNRVPAVVITGTAPLRNARYHRIEDTPDTLDYPRMAQLARSLTSTV